MDHVCSLPRSFHQRNTGRLAFREEYPGKDTIAVDCPPIRKLRAVPGYRGETLPESTFKIDSGLFTGDLDSTCSRA